MPRTGRPGEGGDRDPPLSPAARRAHAWLRSGPPELNPASAAAALCRRASLPLILLASGFAGLAYEVVWTRMLAVVLGSEMAAMLGVVTGFFAGLALGALLLDGPIRRARRPGLAYALLELVIAAWAVASIAILPAAGDAARTLLGTTPSAVVLWAAGFVLPTVVLLPATLAMGGTLVALERLTASTFDGPRRRGQGVAAGVYGANTAGAMAGAIACVLVLLPGLGVSGTMLALAAVNLACALAALPLAAPVETVEPRPAPPAAPDLGDRRLLVLLAGSGLLGIVFEVLVIRLAAQVLQDTIYTFAVLLAAFLFGSALGGLIWQRSRLAPSRTALGWLLVTVATTVLGTAWVLRMPWLQGLRGGGVGWMEELGVAMALFVAPAAAGGALFGCLAQAVRDRRGTLGRAVGVNALGASAAPALASLVLIPAIGAGPSLPLLALAYLLLGPAPPRRIALSATLPLALALGLWLVPGPPAVQIPPGGRLLALLEGPTATAGVVEDSDGTRYLEVNGHFRMGGTSSRRSDWRQAQLPLLLHPAPHRALFLGVGTGATLAGAAAVPGLDLDLTGVELTPEVVALLPWFAEAGAAPLPRIVTADARRFVASDRQEYDVVVADLFHPALDGTGSLYTVEHFGAVRDRLAPGGLFAQWLPLYQLDRSSLAAIISSFLAVYPEGSAWLAHYSLQTPMLVLIGGRAGAMDWAGLPRRLAEPGARRAAAVTGLAGPLDLLGLYVGDARALANFAGPGPANTDDRPFVALDARRNVAALASPPSTLVLALLQDTASGRQAPPSAGSGMNERLRAYWLARDRFVLAGTTVPQGVSGRTLIDAAVPGLLATLRLSPDFDPAYGPVLGMARALLAGRSDADRREGAALLRALVDVAPGRPEARLALESVGGR